MVTDVKEPHPPNAEHSIVVTLLGIVMVVKDLHAANAKSPMVVTPWGMVTDVNDSHPANASSPISVAPSGITTSVSLPRYFVIFVPSHSKEFREHEASGMNRQIKRIKKRFIVGTFLTV